LPRYFEIIITGRQLAALVAGVALAVAVAFGLGLAVRANQPTPPSASGVNVVAQVAPTPVWQPSPPAIPTAVPTAEALPTPPATATPALVTAAGAGPLGTPTMVAPPVTAVGLWVQVVALSFRHQAEGVRNRVVALGYTPRQVVVLPVAGGKFRVRVGPFPDVESAGRVAARLRAEGFAGAFVVKE
jgi:cell division septation protein DedD